MKEDKNIITKKKFYCGFSLILFLLLTILMISACPRQSEKSAQEYEAPDHTTASPPSEPEELPSEPETIMPEKNVLRIWSIMFADMGMMQARYTADGENVNPPLNIDGIPENTKSLALIMDDPDAPRGTWVHWVVFNIPPTIKEIPENTVPEGAVVGKNSWGKSAYGGPDPPSGIHRYFFKLYALDTTLDLDASATKANVEKAMEGHILAQAEFVGKYGR